MTDTLHAHYLALGEQYAKMMAQADISNCNCMVRWNGGPQMPAFKKGDKFFTPSGDEMVAPTSYEMMRYQDIVRLMKQNNETYIGHIY